MRELTPETSYGFSVIDFARDVVGTPLDPWEEEAVIRAGELLPDGRPRFRTVLILVARQNGKTFLLRILKLYWMFVEAWPVILGTSTDRVYAKKDLRLLAETAMATPALAAMLPKRKNRGYYTAIGEEHLETAEGCEYWIAAVNRKAGRSLTLSRVVLDELREHRSWDAWNAATNAMNAQPFGQAFCITNQGDDLGIVLDSLRASALAFIEKGKGDSRLGLIEWSAPDGCDITDPAAIAQANPNLGRRIFIEDILGQAQRAAEAGGEEEASYRTEVLCQRVRQLDGAVDPESWRECFVPGDLSGLTRRAMCLDIAPDRRSATLAAAALMPDGRIRLVLVESWKGAHAIRECRDALPQWIATVKPQVFGWFPNGPAAAMAATLAKKVGVWPPRGVVVEEIRSEVAAVCMGFAEQVEAHEVVHSDEERLNSHVIGASKLWSGDVWRFSRRGEGRHCDGAYAGAGAVHLARTMPAVREFRRILTAAS